MNHKDILVQSSALLHQRVEQNGAEEGVIDRACKIFENITGVEMSLYEGAIFMHSFEMARMRKSRRTVASVVNGIDYLALAAQFSTAEHGLVIDGSSKDLTDGIKEMASKLSATVRPSTQSSTPSKEADK